MLKRVTERLPARKRAIEIEFRRSEPFRGLCEDFCVCAEAMTKWRSSDKPDAALRHREYAGWLQELHGEIEDWLDSLEPRPE